VARACDVSIGAVRKWRYGTRRRPENPDRRIKRDCPCCFDRDLPRHAYAYILGVYLGDGHIVSTSKGCFRLSLSCANEWPGLIDASVTAMATVLPLSKVARRNRGGCTDVHSQSKHWPCLFPQHGPGMKHTRKIALEDWQEEIVATHTEEFVRELIHSDGCRALNRVRRPLQDGDRWYEYPRYFFSNASDDIRRLFTDALDQLGVDWKQSNKRIISVARARRWRGWMSSWGRSTDRSGGGVVCDGVADAVDAQRVGRAGSARG
jgi:hypothetical protein